MRQFNKHMGFYVLTLFLIKFKVSITNPVQFERKKGLLCFLFSRHVEKFEYVIIFKFKIKF